MDDPIVSPLVKSIVNYLSSLAIEEVRLAWCLKNDLKDLKSSLGAIQAVLQDAEDKQWMQGNEGLKHWLRKLKGVAYDADDVLDEFAIEDQWNQQQRDLRNQLRAFFSLDHINQFVSLVEMLLENQMRAFFSLDRNPLVFRVVMAHKMKTIRKRLSVIADERSQYNLTEGVGNRVAAAYDWQLTSSKVNESEIRGRVKEKKDLINMILTSSDDLSIYSIRGLGGIGKTTLAQLTYNDGSITEHFDLRMWVCVSVGFNIKKLVRAIIESIERTSPNMQELDPLLESLQEKLIGKRFLLVLDDVWDDYDNDRWNELKEVLSRGALGSVVLITSRIEMVASRMATTNFVQYIRELSPKDSWLLFERLAFKRRSQEERACLEAIGNSIVEKCSGVPLAIKVLGNLMQHKKSLDEWLDVERSKIWDLRVGGSRILPALMLSYNNLSPELKQCFAFCSIFPKDHVLEKNHMIALWMANGFISSERQLRGDEVFNELVGRSFFQEVEDDGFGNTECTMHDLIHDLAQSVAVQECCLMEEDMQLEIPRTIRHIGLYNRSPASSDKNLLKVQSLRSFLTVTRYGNFDWFGTYHQELSNQKHLRALSVRASRLKQLPEFVCNLKHLRYLDVSYSSIESLPESITSLQNLQTINMRYCRDLCKLPEGMKHMKNLMYFDNTNCYSLRSMPAGMGRLTCLRKLGVFIVGNADGHRVGELELLEHLAGELRIEGLHNIESTTDAQRAKLMEKTNLQSLRLEWLPWVEVGEEMHQDVLSCLRPHNDLKKLKIDGYGGSQLPNWMTNLVLQNLVEIELRSCRNCVLLPPLGKLQYLKRLVLYRMKGVKSINNDLYGDDPPENSPFPSLETLWLDEMINLEEWVPVGDGRQGFARLSEVTVSYCSSLVQLPIIPSIKTLKIEGDCTVTLLRSVGNLTSLVSLDLWRVQRLEFFPDGMLQNNTLLEHLTLIGLLSLRWLPNEILENLSALKSLRIFSCRYLEILPEEGLCNLNSLKTLVISNADRLNYLPDQIGCLTSLSYFSIRGCQELIALPETIQHLTSLRNLQIDECRRFSSLPNQIGGLKSLSRLGIWNCPRLTSLPDGLRNLTKLQYLSIWRCPDLERRCEKERGEDWPKIAHIPKIQIDDQMIQSLG